ncbi:MAG: VWA domain-containing protein [Flavobacteriales bacterium]
MKYGFTFFLALLLIGNAYSQLPSKISDNDNFLVQPEYSFAKHTMTFNVYSVAKKGMIRRIKQHCFWKNDILDYKVSNDAHFLAIYKVDSLIIWNIRKQRIDQSFTYLLIKPEVHFLHHGNSYFVFYPGEELQEYSANVDKPVYTYMMKDNEISAVEADATDEYLFMHGKMNKIYMYRIHGNKNPQSFVGKEYALDTKDSVLVSLLPMGGKYCIMKYGFPRLRRQSKIVPDKEIQRYIREGELSAQNKSTLEYKDARLSKDGHYVAFKVKVDKKEIITFVYDVKARKVINHTSLGEEIPDNLFLVWNEYNELVIQSDEMKVRRYSPAADSLGFKEVDMHFQFYKDKQKLSDEEQIVQRKIGGEAVNEVLPQKSWFSKKILVKSLRTNDEFLTLNKASMLTMSKDGKYLFVEQGDAVAYMKISDSLTANSLTFMNVDVHNLEQPDAEEEDSIMVDGRLVLPSQLDRESVISAYKHIKDLPDDAELQLLYKNVVIGDSLVTVQFQLMDKNGTYYYGASQEAYREIFCNILYNNGNEPYQQVRTYKVSESMMFDTIPNSIALVGDMSGSMGQARVDKLTSGMYNFVDHKFSADEISIVKYDARSKVEAKREVKIKDLRDAIAEHGYPYFGSSTAMLDGIDEAIQAMKSSRVEGVKAVIVLTDGYENSSMTTMNEVIALAKQNNIQVYAIALGDNVNEDLLKKVALHTNGGYYKIRSSYSMEWIFDDIYRKVRSFYEVEFKTDTLGRHKLVLKACQPKCKDCSNNMEVVFDNSFQPKPAIMDVNDPDYFKLFADEDSVKTADTLLASFPDMKDFSQVETKVKTKKKDDAVVETKPVDFEAADKDFSKLTLPRFNFILDNDSIVGDYQLRMDSLVAFLKKHEGISLRIIGHTDDQGSAPYNEKLSLLRAKKVKALLMQRGIDPARLVYEGRGESEPIESNDTEEGRVLNRRIEFEIFEQ